MSLWNVISNRLLKDLIKNWNQRMNTYMTPDMIIKLAVSTGLLILTLVILQIFKVYARKTQRKLKLSHNRYFVIKRILTLSSFIIYGFVLLIIWGINIKSAWVSLTGILAMIAIAFFAVWSLIGNILAGFILFFTSPFKIGDTIEIMPDNVQGNVAAINMFYTMLIDDNGNTLNIPNSLFFQKYIKKIKPDNR